MAIFNRQTMEQITQKMIDWSRGATSQLTDWRVGSKNRTIYEAVAIVLEDFYDKTFKGIKTTIQQNLYTTLGFAPLPAVNTSGTVRFYAQTAPPSNQPFFIPMGTQVQASPTDSTPPITFQTTQDANLVYNSPTETGDVLINGVSVTGWYYVDIPVVCTQSGTIGNVGADTVTTLVGSATGIGAVNNPAAFTTGSEAETLSQQKARFQLFVQSRTRGTLDSIEYAGLSAQVLDSTGTIVQEQVKAAIPVDGDGTFSLYLWNGVGAASQALITQVTNIINGYVDANGNKVYGYKPAGITFNVYSVSLNQVPLAMTITPLNGYGVTDADALLGAIDIRPAITTAISGYFSTLAPGQTLLVSEIENLVMLVQGVYDVQITAPTANITVGSTAVNVPQLPITFSKGTTV